MRIVLAAAVLLSLPCLAADKKIAPKTVEDSNENVVITATPYLDRESITTLLGRDPGFLMIILEVKFAPRGENKIALWRDDFTLLSSKDGQRSQPLSPGQLAGRGAIMVSSRGYTPASGMGDNNQGPIWGGGPAGTTRPRRIGDQDTRVTEGSAGETKAQVSDGSKEKENPLLAILKEKVLPEKETAEPVSGLLYFILDGKHKPKDLELIYKSQGQRLILDFGK